MQKAGTERNQKISKDAAKEELAAMAELSPLAWAHHVDPSYELPNFLQELDYNLVELEQRNIRFLIVNMPARHGKSFACSKWFPAWYLRKHPSHHVLLGSYEAGLARTFGRGARDLFVKHSKRKIREDVAAQGDWEIEKYNGGMFCAGIGGPFGGRGGDLLIVDDPIKNHAQARSFTYRQNVIDWWATVARRRLEKDGVAMVVMTRWDVEDLCGYLIHKMQTEIDADQFAVVKFPLLRGERMDQPLWPERFPLANCKAQVIVDGPYWSAALSMQDPIKHGGGEVDTSLIEVIEPSALPKIVAMCRGWDFAATGEDKGQGRAFTAGVLIGIAEDTTPRSDPDDKRGYPVFLDVKRVQREPAAVKRLVKQTTAIDGPTIMQRFEEEGGSAGKFVSADIAAMLVGYSFRCVHPTGSKEIRRIPLVAQINAGRCKMVRGPWNDAFIEEFNLLPHSPTKDISDSAAAAFEELATNWVNTDNIAAGTGVARTVAADSLQYVSRDERPATRSDILVGEEGTDSRIVGVRGSGILDGY